MIGVKVTHSQTAMNPYLNVGTARGLEEVRGLHFPQSATTWMLLDCEESPAYPGHPEQTPRKPHKEMHLKTLQINQDGTLRNPERQENRNRGESKGNRQKTNNKS